jgi:CO/xanthine dehydrogenase Mo-binding subunit
VAVDEDSGRVTLLDAGIAVDVGVALDERSVDGQLRGAFAQGIGGALLEAFRFDESEQPQSTTFINYLLPTVDDVPELEVVISQRVPASDNPLGVRGAGESGLPGVAPAIANAISSALNDVDGSFTSLPISPGGVWEVAQARHGARGSS